jgi:hypothetical protein
LAYIGWYFGMSDSPVVSVKGPQDWSGVFGNASFLPQLPRYPVNRLLKSPQGAVGIKLADRIDSLAGDLAIPHYCGACDRAQARVRGAGRS